MLYLFIISLNDILWTSIDLITENSFKSKKQEVDVETITDARLHRCFGASHKYSCPKQNLKYIGLNKQQQALASLWMQIKQNSCFKWEGDISTLSVKPLKLIDKFTYLSSNISSTESNVNICLAKAWTTISRLSTIWEFDLSGKIKQDFFQAVWMHHMDVIKMHRKKAWWELHNNAMCCLE